MSLITAIPKSKDIFRWSLYPWGPILVTSCYKLVKLLMVRYQHIIPETVRVSPLDEQSDTLCTANNYSTVNFVVNGPTHQQRAPPVLVKTLFKAANKEISKQICHYLSPVNLQINLLMTNHSNRREISYLAVNVIKINSLSISRK